MGSVETIKIHRIGTRRQHPGTIEVVYLGGVGIGTLGADIFREPKVCGRDLRSQDPGYNKLVDKRLA
jgi:hypothetical protein